MSLDLEHLIERIKAEALEQAEAESERILDQARSRAAGIIRDAEAQAASRVHQGEMEARAYQEQSERTLEQAGRDLLMSIGQGVHNILIDLVRGAVGEALDIGLLRDLITRAVEAYLEREGAETRIKVLLCRNDKEKLLRFFQHRYQDMVTHDLEFEVDKDVYKGFRVSYGDEDVYHDFSEEAIAQALINYLNPHLSDIIARVVRQNHDEAEGNSP